MNEHDERPELSPPPEDRPRGLPPVAIPVVALFGMLILVFAGSRILLIVSHTQAAVIALFMAMNVLIGAALVSAGRWVRNRPASFPLLMLGGVLVVAAGGVAMAMGAGKIEPPEGIPVVIVAEGIQFVPTELTVPADEPLAIEFDNRDAGTPHNVHIGETEEPPEPTGPGLLIGEVVDGPIQTTYDLREGLPEGVFGFICDVHPNMTGTITAEVGAPPPGEGPPGEEPSPAPTTGEPTGEPTAEPPPTAEPDVVAEGLVFEPTELTATAEGGEVTLVFENADDGIPHNIAIRETDDPASEVVFSGELISGPATVEYKVAGLAPGRHAFFCEVHPDMQGILTVE